MIVYKIGDFLKDAEVRVYVSLKKGEALLDPNSTKGRKIYGPVDLWLMRWPEGGIGVQVL